MKIKKSTIILIVLLILSYSLANYVGLVQSIITKTSEYFQLIDNYYLLILTIAFSTALTSVPTYFIFLKVQKSIHDMTSSFQIIQQEHQDCCKIAEQSCCEKYYIDLQNLRSKYKFTDQRIVIFALLYQVGIFGFFFAILSNSIQENMTQNVSLLVYIHWFLLFSLILAIISQLKNQFKTFKSLPIIKKNIFLLLGLVGLYWLFNFTFDEILFLILFIIFQSIFNKFTKILVE
ncbi:hypothetical protein AEA09_16240 [Lysinibacillus contaminans]|uniref:Transmembrane protein n=1 Tax=Lysinibacillus contaminans TaxID=1293441 RepID=A0ABR5JYN3_9BACI|nr:hypothetical protein [Lysinibacillus contaminans]KOS66790.1 hypothetical protein AEA09_16240 [Lysinibacillus contaminans]